MYGHYYVHSRFTVSSQALSKHVEFPHTAVLNLPSAVCIFKVVSALAIVRPVILVLHQSLACYIVLSLYRCLCYTVKCLAVSLPVLCSTVCRCIAACAIQYSVSLYRCLCCAVHCIAACAVQYSVSLYRCLCCAVQCVAVSLPVL
jgi:hypothetical protein